ncbi:NAD(P)-binding protein [Dichomitus squalens]|uniref:NAD(P)-binding protein n=1 Tax=Dichomitus squalens TaxID=114155 RepID=A0A4Q9PTJ5_9APHY|nr:NAD(P)-binding protein [Dichomitus squalens]
MAELLFNIKGQLKLLQQSLLPPKATFSPDQIPDLTGKVTLVTGGNTGVGYEIVKELLRHNAKVYLAARSEEKATVAIERLKKETGKEAHFLHLDLGNIASVRKAAEDFLAKETALHTLFNNAGVMWSPVADVTADGYDLQFGTNVLGHFLLTKLLLPALLKGKESSGDGHARVITTTSPYAYIGHINFDTLKDGPARRKQSTEVLYQQSKLGDILVAFELARRYGEQGIVSVTLHPGILKTDLLRHTNFVKRAALESVYYPPAMGALTPLYAGTTPEGLKLNGKYLIPWAREAEVYNKEAYDEDLARRLWEWLEEQVKAT